MTPSARILLKQFLEEHRQTEPVKLGPPESPPLLSVEARDKLINNLERRRSEMITVYAGILIFIGMLFLSTIALYLLRRNPFLVVVVSSMAFAAGIACLREITRIIKGFWETEQLIQLIKMLSRKTGIQFLKTIKESQTEDKFSEYNPKDELLRYITFSIVIICIIFEILSSAFDLNFAIILAWSRSLLGSSFALFLEVQFIYFRKRSNDENQFKKRLPFRIAMIAILFILLFSSVKIFDWDKPLSMYFEKYNTLKISNE